MGLIGDFRPAARLRRANSALFPHIGLRIGARVVAGGIQPPEDHMATWGWIVIAVAVLVIVGVITLLERQRRTALLRDRFGDEYDRTVESRQGQRAAETELRERQRRRAKLDIKPLTEASRLRYTEEWRMLQEQFVDRPAETVRSADGLLHQVMAERGYPVSDFAARSDLISVDHPEVAENYRTAHATYERVDSGAVSTEELRDALLRYRSLFDEMLRAGQDEAGTAATSTGAVRDVPDTAPGRVAVPAQRAAGQAPTGSEGDDESR
jgi:hypothetical protein